MSMTKRELAKRAAKYKTGKGKGGGGGGSSGSGGSDPVEARKSKFKRDRVETWELNGLHYASGVSESDMSGDTALADRIANGTVVANGVGGRRVHSLEVNKPYHDHLARGSSGVAFCFIQENDYTVTPCIYDIATGRGRKKGNKYSWRVGGGEDYNSTASLPGPTK